MNGQRVYVIGYPGAMGGANTEALHTVRLWRSFGLDIHLVPTWQADSAYRARLDALGCTTHDATPADLERVPGLAGSIAVGFCNQHFMHHAVRLKAIGCKLVWVNCMTFLQGHEANAFEHGALPDAFVFQSEFQRRLLEKKLAAWGYQPEQGHLIRGAFFTDEFEFRPLFHRADSPFFVGRMARPDPDKWSARTWDTYGRIQYQHTRGRLLGVNDRVRQKIGPTPKWGQCFEPQSVPVTDFLAGLHCLLPINGGARENWPRAGLEAMAAGVPIVAENDWGWREMVEHGRTGFLGSTPEGLAHWAAVLAYDEPLRLRIAREAHERLRDELANPTSIWAGWQEVFGRLLSNNSADKELSQCN